MKVFQAHHRRIIMAAAMLLLLGTTRDAAGGVYRRAKVGKLEGKLVVQWLEPDVFLFIPDPEKPLTFTRNNGEVIQPGRMLTDGGSIPRPMWAFRSYSPWGYAPAFIVHDWIFHAKRCEVGDYNRYTMKDAANIMAEVMKTMMESGKVERDAATVELMYKAVNSVFAKRVWEKGDCVPVPAGFDRAPLAEYVLEFP